MFGVYHLTESANILMLSRRLCLETFFDLIFPTFLHNTKPFLSPTMNHIIFHSLPVDCNCLLSQTHKPPTKCCTLQLDATSCTRVGHLGHWGRAEQCRHDPDATVGRSGRRHRPSWSKLPSAAADREQSCENMWRDTSALDSTYWWLSPC